LVEVKENEKSEIALIFPAEADEKMGMWVFLAAVLNVSKYERLVQAELLCQPDHLQPYHLLC